MTVTALGVLAILAAITSEFLLDMASANRWSALLPPRRMT